MTKTEYLSASFPVEELSLVVSAFQSTMDAGYRLLMRDNFTQKIEVDRHREFVRSLESLHRQVERAMAIVAAQCEKIKELPD